jgi:hypothetical protein
MSRKKQEKRVQTPEESRAITISHAMDSLPNIPSNIPPSRRFKVGDKVRVGALENPVVEEVLEGGRIYLIRHGLRKTDSHPVTAFPWMSVKPLAKKETAFADDYDLRASYSNTCLDGLIGKVYHFGVDFDPPFQRGLVWTQAQKEALIKTIFDMGSIGTFAFNRLPYCEGKLYEVIDGKQRLNALCEFYEDRWPYNGVYYSELSGNDTSVFKMTSVLEVTLKEATEEAKLRLFLRINRAGTPVDVEHIRKVEERLKAITEKK